MILNELQNLLRMAESEVEDGKHEQFVTCKIDAGLRTLKEALDLIEKHASLKQEEAKVKRAYRLAAKIRFLKQHMLNTSMQEKSEDDISKKFKTFKRLQLAKKVPDPLR